MSRNFTQIVLGTDTFGNWLSLSNQMANAYKNVVTTATNTAGDTTAGNAFISGTIGGNTVVVNYQLRGGTVDTAANLALVSNVTFSGANSTFTSNVYVNASNATINAATFSVRGVSINAVTISTNSTATNTRFVSNTLLIQGTATVVNATSFSNSVAVTGPVSLSNTMSFPEAVMGSNTVNAPTSAAVIVDSFDKGTYRGGKYIISIKDNANSVYQMTEILLLQDGDLNSYVTEFATLRHIANNLVVFSSNISSTTVRLWATPTVANSTYKFSRNLIVV